MATTFNVFSLGPGPIIDPIEGNNSAEDAGLLVGMTFGAAGNPISNSIRTFSPGSTGFGAGDPNHYDNNNAGDTFSIDGGPDQTFDAVVVYNATVTYTDGTTAVTQVIVFQDTEGNLYIAPSPIGQSPNPVLTAQPIRSFTLESIAWNENVGLWFDRHPGDFKAPVCFAAGTRILTPRGEVPVGQLRVGDRVCTLDNGPMPIRWIGSQRLGPGDLAARPKSRPILLPAGFLGARRPVLVSPQHAILVGKDWLVRARHLCHLPGSGVRVAHGKRGIVYVHLLLDSHQILLADGLPAESLWPGPQAMASLPFAVRLALGGGAAGHLRSGGRSGHVPGPFAAPARHLARRKHLRNLVAPGGVHFRLAAR